MTGNLVDTGSGETEWFLVEIQRHGRLYAHGIFNLAQVTDRIAEREYDSAAGEVADVINVWHLGFGHPCDVQVSMKRHDQIGYMEITYRWHQFSGNDKAGSGDGQKFIERSDSAYFKLP